MGGADEQGVTTAGSAAEAQVALGSPGAVVAVLDGDDLEVAGAGVADLATGEPMTSSHRLRTGSIGKTYTAAIILLLVADGRLGLDDRASSYFPELDPRITIRFLLSHRSGLFNHVEDGELAERNFFGAPHEADPREQLAVALRYPLRFAPGQGLEYSNTGFQVLGLIAEELTGQQLADLHSTLLFEPLGLGRTSFGNKPQLEPGLAHGFALPGGCFPTVDGPVDATRHLHGAWADGAIVSDAADLVRFHQTLLRGDVVPAALLTEMLDGPFDPVRKRIHGLGIFGRETRCGVAWGHNGAYPGYLSGLLATAAGGRVVAVLTNGQGPGIGLAILRALPALLCADSR